MVVILCNSFLGFLRHFSRVATKSLKPHIHLAHSVNLRSVARKRGPEYNKTYYGRQRRSIAAEKRALLPPDIHYYIPRDLNN